jgi:hypothetical protein
MLCSENVKAVTVNTNKLIYTHIKLIPSQSSKLTAVILRGMNSYALRCEKELPGNKGRCMCSNVVIVSRGFPSSDSLD